MKGVNYSLDSFLGPKTWDINNNKERNDLDGDFRINKNKVSRNDLLCDQSPKCHSGAWCTLSKAYRPGCDDMERS